MNTLYLRIKELADLKNISLAQIERTLNFSNGIISTWKTKQASADKIIKVSKYLGVSTDYLLGESDEKHNPEDGSVDIADDKVLMTYQGKPLSKEDREMMLRIMRGKE